jgi:hypothetical protein
VTASSTAHAELEAALAAVVAAARRYQQSLPDASGLPRLPTSRFEISLDPRQALPQLARATEAIEADVRLAAQRERAVIAGSAFCLRCGHALCEHAVPAGPREVFAGWLPSGRPAWVDFGQLLVDRADPRVDRLFGGPPTVLALTQRPAELTAKLLPAFRAVAGSPEILGQVSAGWFRVPGIDGTVAITLQLLSTGRRRERKIFLHPVVAPALQARWGELESPPWAAAIESGREDVAQLEHFARTTASPWAQVVQRIDSVLGGLAANLERPERARRRRTQHAELRRDEGRPVSTALADLEVCPEERFFRDPSHHTWIVVGPKGRTHVFAEDGRHVTSVRYNAAALTRRVERGRWKPATLAERDALLAAVRARAETAGSAKA